MVRRFIVLISAVVLLLCIGLVAGRFVPVSLAQDVAHRVFLPFVNVLDDGDNDNTFFSHYESVFIVDIQNRVYVESSPPLDRTVIYTGGTGDLARYIANWKVGDYTGYYPVGSMRDTQRGAPDGGYGTTAVQMEGFVAGFHLDSTNLAPVVAIQFAQLHYEYRSAPLPWSRGRNPRFCLDFDATLTHSNPGSSASNSAYAQIAFADANTNQRIWLLMSMYDSRPDTVAHGDVMSLWEWQDGEDPQRPIVHKEPILYAYFNDDHATRLPGSGTSGSATWSEWRYFGFCMSSDQMLRIVREANQQFGLTLSENVAAYGISSFGIGPESYNPKHVDASISMRVKDVHLFTLAEAQ